MPSHRLSYLLPIANTNRTLLNPVIGTITVCRQDVKAIVDVAILHHIASSAVSEASVGAHTNKTPADSDNRLDTPAEASRPSVTGYQYLQSSSQVSNCEIGAGMGRIHEERRRNGEREKGNGEREIEGSDALEAQHPGNCVPRAQLSPTSSYDFS